MVGVGHALQSTDRLLRPRSSRARPSTLEACHACTSTTPRRARCRAPCSTRTPTRCGIVGNPSSIHSDGQAAKAMLEDARAAIAASVNADPMEVMFTSGGTEAINLAIKGLFWRRAERGYTRILLTGAEHHATLDAAQWLAKHEGAVLDWVPVDEVGRIDLAALETRLAAADDVALVTTLWANNEVGTVQPVRDVVALAEAHGVPVHADAVGAYLQCADRLRGDGAGRDESLCPQDRRAGGRRRARRGARVGAGGAHPRRRPAACPLRDDGCRGCPRVPRGDGAVTAPRMAAAAHLAALRDRLVAGVRAAVPAAVLRGDPDLSVDAAGRGAGCRATRTSRSRGARATRCCTCSTPPASRCRPGRRARRGCPRHPMCCSRWG